MGELGDTSTACAAGAANPMTDPGHPCAAVGPPTDPDRTRPSTAWWRDAPPGAWIRPDGLPDRDPRTIAPASCRRHPRVRVGSRLGLEVDLCASGNVGGYRARPAPGWERWRLLRCCSSRLPSRWTRRRARPGWRARPSRRVAARPRRRSRCRSSTRMPTDRAPTTSPSCSTASSTRWRESRVGRGARASPSAGPASCPPGGTPWSSAPWPRTTARPPWPRAR